MMRRLDSNTPHVHKCYSCIQTLILDIKTYPSPVVWNLHNKYKKRTEIKNFKNCTMMNILENYPKYNPEYNILYCTHANITRS